MVIQEMQDKHPQAPPPTLPPGPTPPSVEVSDRIVLQGVKSFPKGSAPDPSALCPSHLHEAVCCPSPDRACQVLTSLTKFVNLLATGSAPCSICPHLCGATLLASRKKNGGLRPIAVGEVLRRLVSKSLSSATRHEAFNSLAPLQQGVSVRGGCEAIIHSVSQLMSSETPEHCWTLLLDFSNAFNSINRESMFVEVRRASLLCQRGWSSVTPPNLFSTWVQTPSTAAVGCSKRTLLDPLGFSLALHPVVEHIRTEVPGLVLNAWYLDDGTLMGSPEDLAAALRIIEDEGPSVGLHLNRAKSLPFIPEESDASLSSLPSDIPTTRGGFTLLGCPIGPPSYCEEVFGGRVAKVKSSLGALGDIADSQMETSLLRSCLARPKVSFILRTCPISHIRHSAEEFDNAVHDVLETTMGGHMSDWSWLKAFLPSSLGGLNLRSASLHAPAAFLASTLQSSQIVERILGHQSGISSHTNSTLAFLAVAAAHLEWSDLDNNYQCPSPPVFYITCYR